MQKQLCLENVLEEGSFARDFEGRREVAELGMVFLEWCPLWGWAAGWGEQGRQGMGSGGGAVGRGGSAARAGLGWRT